MKMVLFVLVGLVIFLLLIVTPLIFVYRLRAKRSLPDKFKEKWLEIQRLCSSKESWGLAVITADKLLETGLKKKRFKGKSMGERMVTAQHVFTDNDAVWYAHNLAKKLIANSKSTLREAEAKKSLVGFRQALRDIGMLNGK